MVLWKYILILFSPPHFCNDLVSPLQNLLTCPLTSLLAPGGGHPPSLPWLKSVTRNTSTWGRSSSRLYLEGLGREGKSLFTTCLSMLFEFLFHIQKVKIKALWERKTLQWFYIIHRINRIQALRMACGDCYLPSHCNSSLSPIRMPQKSYSFHCLFLNWPLLTPPTSPRFLENLSAITAMLPYLAHSPWEESCSLLLLGFLDSTQYLALVTLHRWSFLHWILPPCHWTRAPWGEGLCLIAKVSVLNTLCKRFCTQELRTTHRKWFGET